MHSMHMLYIVMFTLSPLAKGVAKTKPKGLAIGLGFDICWVHKI